MDNEGREKVALFRFGVISPSNGSGVYAHRESWQGVDRIRCSYLECRQEYFRSFSCRGFHS